jgi:hypothetical protein
MKKALAAPNGQRHESVSDSEECKWGFVRLGPEASWVAIDVQECREFGSCIRVWSGHLAFSRNQFRFILIISTQDE